MLKKLRTTIVATTCRVLMPNFYEFIAEQLIDSSNYLGVMRPSTLMAKKIFGSEPLTVVEVGTGLGVNALNLLSELNIKKLYCVDPFIPYADDSENSLSKSSQERRSYIVQAEQTVQKLSSYSNVQFVRKSSAEACKEISNVDFVYVDGNHSYEHVLEDLKNYYPLVKEKGIIAGHDIGRSNVYRALYDFCKANSVVPFILRPDWVILKWWVKN